MNQLKGQKEINMHSEHRIEFEKELRKHPSIMSHVIQACAEHNDGEHDEGIVVGTVAAIFNIAMDGMYTRQQMDDMYFHLTHLMRGIRKEIIH